jgi:hypothetical protein
VNESSTGTPVGSKFDTFRVATISPCSSAVAATAKSRPLLPILCDRQAPAACHGDIDRENPALPGAQNRVESNPEARCERRIELPLSFDPSFVSPIVTALTKRSREDTLPIH